MAMTIAAAAIMVQQIQCATRFSAPPMPRAPAVAARPSGIDPRSAPRLDTNH
jgi:hypothetical protein